MTIQEECKIWFQPPLARKLMVLSSLCKVKDTKISTQFSVKHLMCLLDKVYTLFFKVYTLFFRVMW